MLVSRALVGLTSRKAVAAIAVAGNIGIKRVGREKVLTAKIRNSKSEIRNKFEIPNKQWF
jgi:hypothetical protein